MIRLLFQICEKLHPHANIPNANRNSKLAFENWGEIAFELCQTVHHQFALFEVILGSNSFEIPKIARHLGRG